MKRIEIKVEMNSEKVKLKAMKLAIVAGVTSVATDGNKLVVKGDGVDSVKLANSLKKKIGPVSIESITEKANRATPPLPTQIGLNPPPMPNARAPLPSHRPESARR